MIILIGLLMGAVLGLAIQVHLLRQRVARLELEEGSS